MRTPTLRLTCTLLMLSGVVLAAPPAPATKAPTITRTLGRLDFSPCTLASGLSGRAIEGHCTTFKVPEDRDAKDGRQLELAVALIPASREAVPDPVFMLAGGPGQSALESYAQVAPAFAELRKTHHIILVDQRGTGGSNRLRCPAPDEGDNDARGAELAAGKRDAGVGDDVAQAKALTQACADALSKKADLRFYSTTDAIADLDDVRQAIGAETINLMGISYGTRVAQQYAKRYPTHTRTVTLDGVVPNTLVLGNEHAKNLERSLTAQFEACAKDARCQAKLGNPRARLNDLLQLLAKNEPVVNYRDAITGEAKQGKLTRRDVTVLARMFSYAPQAMSLLPLVLNEAALGRYEPLLALSKLISSSFSEALSPGMELSVICTEDESELTVDPADANSLLGNDIITAIKTQCAVWPHRDRPKDFRTPLTGPVPVLVLSGEFDPVTPPKYGDEVLQSLPNGRHLVVKGQGHNVVGAGCVPKLFSQFVASANAKSLDVACLDKVARALPFIEFYGWDP